MIGDAALRKIIGADALGAVAGADLLAAVRRAGRVDALLLGVVDAGAQDVHRRRAILVLRTAVLHHHHDAGRNMRDADRGLGLLTCWPPAPCERMVSIRRSSLLMSTSTSSTSGSTATVAAEV